MREANIKDAKKFSKEIKNLLINWDWTSYQLIKLTELFPFKWCWYCKKNRIKEQFKNGEEKK